jgi:hypothetical protein
MKHLTKLIIVNRLALTILGSGLAVGDEPPTKRDSPDERFSVEITENGLPGTDSYWKTNSIVILDNGKPVG